MILSSDEWVTVPCEAIVSESLWDECNSILDAQESRNRRPGPKPAYLLSGLVRCACDKTMYVFHSSRVYECRGCKNRIPVDDIDEIFQAHLSEYLQTINRADYLAQHTHQLEEAKRLLENAKKERGKLAKQINEFIDMRASGELSKAAFAERYWPIEERVQQLDGHMPELEAEIDLRTVQMMSEDRMVQEAQTLQGRWAEIGPEERRAFVESVTSEITVDKEEITIRFGQVMPLSPNGGKSPQKHRDSCL